MGESPLATDEIDPQEVASAAVSAQTNVRAPSPGIEIQPARAQVDEPVAIRLTGFAAGQHVTLRARMARLGCTWESHAAFVADAQGRIDVPTQKPITGTYEQVDPMGLFWSMAPSVGAEPQGQADLVPLRVQLDAVVDGTVVALAEAERQFLAAGVTRTEVRDIGMVGTLLRPPRSGPRPAVVVVGGSGGGLWEAPAALLASHGFVTLALAYFGIESLPPGLMEIPLEYFGTAIRWLQQLDAVDPHSVGVLGQSRGGELALLLGATFPEIRAVVGYVPSGVMWGAVQRADTERSTPSAAWIHDGQPLPFMEKAINETSTTDEIRSMKAAIDWSHPPIALTPGFLAALQKEEAVAQATIPVEHTRGPIIMISGQDDQMWPSHRLAEIAVQRLKRHSFAFQVEHLSYPHAGHLVSVPYLPTTIRHSRHPITKVDFAYGGTPAGDAFARADSWPKVVAFLSKHLGGG